VRYLPHILLYNVCARRGHHHVFHYRVYNLCIEIHLNDRTWRHDILMTRSGYILHVRVCARTRAYCAYYAYAIIVLTTVLSRTIGVIFSFRIRPYKSANVLVYYIIPFFFWARTITLVKKSRFLYYRYIYIYIYIY